MDANLSSGIGAVVSSIIGAAFASSDNKKQRQMTERLEKLSLEQQKEIALRLQDVNEELAKQEIIYKYLAVQNNNELLASIKSKRYIMYIAIGAGVVVFGVLALKLLNKK